MSDSRAGLPTKGPGTALAQRRPIETSRDPDWQRFWLSLEKQQWHTLALVPAGDGAAADFTLGLAVTLSRTGMLHLGGPIQVADGHGVAIDQLNGFLADVRSCTAGGDRVIVALPPVAANPTAPAIAKATDAAILCVLLDKMSSTQARQTLKLVGASRFIGSLIIHASD